MLRVCVSAGYLASYWNVANFPEFCSDSSMDNKTTYNTMVRIGGSWAGMGMAFVWIMKTYQWKQAALLTDTTTSYCWYGGTAIYSHLLASNMTLLWVRMSATPTVADIDDYLSQARSRARGMTF
jgi:hypothetical protein